MDLIPRGSPHAESDASGPGPGHTRGMDLIPREYIALPGGALRRVYSVQAPDGSLALGDHGAWLASRAARCSCGAVCRGSGRTCGDPECIATLAGLSLKSA
jgi:hypothetical protein